MSKGVSAAVDALPGSDHGERGIEGARIERLRPGVADVEGNAIGQTAFQLNFERIVSGEIVGVENVQAAGVLRERDKEERLAGGQRGDGLRALQAGGERIRESADGIQIQIRGIEAADHRGGRFAGVQASIGAQNAVDQAESPPALTVLNASRKPLV